jgi:hypothetical protein
MNYSLDRYNKYKTETILCPFCDRIMDIYGIYQHTNSLRCKNIQNLKYNEIELNEKKVKLLIIIDKLRYDIRNDIK